MRTLEDANEFLTLAEQEGDKTAHEFPFPPELSWQKTQLIMKIGKRERVMWENTITWQKYFYTIHPAWKSHRVYENMPDFTR